jgi:hypothetical protein
MNISRRLVFAVIPISLLWASAGHAGSAGSWDGTWAGAWGGKETEATSVTVAGKRVVSYEYQGVSHPVSTSKVTPTKIVYEDQGVTVTLTRTSDTKAAAALHSDQGDATAELTRR